MSSSRWYQPELIRGVCQVDELRQLFKPGTDLAKALAAGERWITIHSPGHEKGQPLLIKEQPDGSAKVIGGAGGSLNQLRLTSVRSAGAYKEEARRKGELRNEEKRRQKARDVLDGLDKSKAAAKEALKDQLHTHEARFVQTVASDSVGTAPSPNPLPRGRRRRGFLLCLPGALGLYLPNTSPKTVSISDQERESAWAS